MVDCENVVNNAKSHEQIACISLLFLEIGDYLNPSIWEIIIWNNISGTDFIKALIADLNCPRCIIAANCYILLLTSLKKG